MYEDIVTTMPSPESEVTDVLTEVLRDGARRLLADAIEAEVEAFLAHYAQHRDDQGRRLVV